MAKRNAAVEAAEKFKGGDPNARFKILGSKIAVANVRKIPKRS